ncbi:MAG: Na+/H+ antiporter NhaC family protein [Tissierellia bacterium]|nr:Na+/H+ antiporter NhaC family protein [Tissierellia bacterium]
MEETINMGILSLIPIIITILLSIKTKNVLLSLAVGVFSGVLLYVGGNPVKATTTMVSELLFLQLQDSYNAGVIILLVFIGGFVSLIEESGGAGGFAKMLAKKVNTAAKAQIAAWVAGIAVFFSELGTPLIVGPIFSPLFKKLGVSKEKLAWILDTTGSPVCILIPFIGWGVYSMGLIQKEFELLNITGITDFQAFIQAIPFQFYAIFCLILVPTMVITKKEIGPMKKAEEEAEKEVYEIEEGKEDIKETNPLVVLIPLLILFVTLFSLLIPHGFPFKKVPGSLFRVALITAYFYGSIAIILLMAYYKVFSIKESIPIYIKGLSKMTNTIMILVLAWSLGAVGKSIGTAEYIIGLAKGNVAPSFVPALIFLIGATISFSTGTSWGTFAIMMPIALPMAARLDASMIVTIAAVLSGGLFGDHCSPISDTTILSSAGAGCETYDHVKTQIPYALIAGVISFIAYIVAGIMPLSWMVVAFSAILVISILVMTKVFGERVH